MTLVLRPATESDARILFDWRNDPLTRQNSINTHPVSWETHLHWLSGALTQTNRQLLIAESEGEPVGTVRLDHLSDHCEISWTVATTHRGRNIGMAMVSKAIAEIKSSGLVAKIRRENIASIRIAEACGFRCVNVLGELLVYRRD